MKVSTAAASAAPGQELSDPFSEAALESEPQGQRGITNRGAID
jgi:hypothetical protein